jgi:hypothetical protein
MSESESFVPQRQSLEEVRVPYVLTDGELGQYGRKERPVCAGDCGEKHVCAACRAEYCDKCRPYVHARCAKAEGRSGCDEREVSGGCR